MAGIGFVLRKLTWREDLLGLVQGYSHSVMAAAGPWLFTIVMLAAVVTLGSETASPQEMEEFRLVIIYNFAFSLVLSGPIVLVATRYLADGLYARSVERAPAMLMEYLLILFGSQIVIVAPFYFWFVELDLAARTIAVVNFLVISGIWLTSVFLTALKDYRSVTRSFALGTILSLALAPLFGSRFELAGMLLGATVGLAAILFALLARVFAEYPSPVRLPLDARGYFTRYWELAASGLVYNAAIWIDKWVMWFAPESSRLASGLRSYPDYDSAMFLAYLTIVPSIAAFLLSIETDFFEKYAEFYRTIQNHGSYEAIEQNHQAILGSVLRGARNFIVLQGSISIAAIAASPQIFTLFGISFAQIAMFRIGVLGAFFHVLFLALSILLAYFDMRRAALALQLLFLASNGLLSWGTMRLGFAYYGYGYFLSAILAASAAFLRVASLLNERPYRTFVLHNPAVRRASQPAAAPAG